MPTTRPVRVSALAVTASRAITIGTRPRARARLKLLFLISVRRSMADLSSFKQYYRLADVLIEPASKEQLAECTRLLALNLAHYLTAISLRFRVSALRFLTTAVNVTLSSPDLADPFSVG